MPNAVSLIIQRSSLSISHTFRRNEYRSMEMIGCRLIPSFTTNQIISLTKSNKPHRKSSMPNFFNFFRLTFRSVTPWASILISLDFQTAIRCFDVRKFCRSSNSSAFSRRIWLVNSCISQFDSNNRMLHLSVLLCVPDYWLSSICSLLTNLLLDYIWMYRTTSLELILRLLFTNDS